MQSAVILIHKSHLRLKTFKLQQTEMACLIVSETKLIVNHHSFGSYKTKQVKSSINCLILRACSHEPGTVNYPGVMIAPGQASPRVDMMICCPGATLPPVNFIAPGQVYRHLITTNLSEFL